jgi:hypothetical protein
MPLIWGETEAEYFRLSEIVDLTRITKIRSDLPVEPIGRGLLHQTGLRAKQIILQCGDEP